MAVFKCKMCGGSLEVSEKTGVAVCEYCGSEQTIPRGDDDVRTNLFNRANNLRLKCDFDKAQQVYEKILNADNTDAEAHWGVVLCKYGIEYVEDPKTHKRLPTCHRTQYESVLTDVDYLAAIENADTVQRGVYTTQALDISRLQKDILAIVEKEKPFDVFLCYKETDENGKRTVDSSLANDIYYQLTNEGLKVFYAAITLEDKLGQEYEPYIFAALHSAKVMIVIGTKPEYFEAVWVRNEWSRFLSFMKTDRTKLLIPCYRDMDAYDLPEEFSHLQAQDMAKIGFVNDVVRGIRKVVVGTQSQAVPSAETVVMQTSSGANVVALKKRGFMALEDGEWEKADGFFEEALNQDAEDAECYLGKLMAEKHVRQREELSEQNAVFSENNLYRRAMRFASPELKSELQSYIAAIQKRENEKAKEKSYQSAIQSMRAAISEEDYRAVAKQFSALGDYKEASQHTKLCLRNAEVQRQTTEQLDELIKEAQVHLNALANKIHPMQKALEEIEAEITARKKQNASLFISDDEELYELQDRYIAYYDAHADVLDPAEELIDQYAEYIQNVKNCMKNAVSNDMISKQREQLQLIEEREIHIPDAYDTEGQSVELDSECNNQTPGASDPEKSSKSTIKMICPECGFELFTEPSSFADETCPSCGTLLVEEAECETYDIEPVLPYLVQDDEVAAQIAQMSPEELYAAYMNEAENSAECRQLCYQQMLKNGVVENPDAGLCAALMQIPTGSDEQGKTVPRNIWIKIAAIVAAFAILLTVILMIRSIY